MKRLIYPPEMYERVSELMNTYNNYELTEIINREFGFNLTKDKMKSYMSNHHLRRSARLKRVYPSKSIFTKEQQAFIKENYKGVGPKEMAEILNKKYNTSFTRMNLKGYYRNQNLNSGLTGRFEKGNKPWCKGMAGKMPPSKFNSGRFQKGNIPTSHKEVGTVSKRADGYWIKISEPNVWKQYHRMIYEQCYGDIPTDCNIDFKDGDRFNIRPENLILVTKGEHCSLNAKKLRTSNADITEAALNIIKIDNLVKERRKNGNRRNTS